MSDIITADALADLARFVCLLNEACKATGFRPTNYSDFLISDGASSDPIGLALAWDGKQFGVRTG